MTLDDLEHQNRGFCVIFGDFGPATHFLRANCAEIARDRPAQLAYETFSIQGILGAYGGVKLEYPLQNTRIQPLKRQRPRETVAPSGICKYIIPNDRIDELRFCSQWAFKCVLLSCVFFCVSRGFSCFTVGG